MRVLVINGVQMGVVVLAGFSWERWLSAWSVFHLSNHVGRVAGGLIAYFIATFIFYWWHRWRHEVDVLWRGFHQIHHSPQRIEVITSFYKHPLEMVVNSIIGSLLVYTLLGLSPAAGAVYTLCTALGEFFYHTSVRTPRCVGFFFQRPEMHRIHHQYERHKNNYGDIVWWDMLFGTYENPKEWTHTCGFDDEKEQQLLAMLMYRDVHAKSGGKNGGETVMANAERRSITANRPLMAMGALLVLLSLSGCVSDRSADPRLAGVMHQCFRFTDDAVLYQTPNCPPTNSGGGTSTCTTVRYLRSFSLPVSLNEFNSNSQGAADRVAEHLKPTPTGGPLLRALSAPPKATLFGTLTAGTSFTVEGMRRFSHPEQGSIWITTVQIRDGEFSGRKVTLPWDSLDLEFQGDGAWIKDFVQRAPFSVDPYRPLIDSSAMVPCKSSATTN